MTAPARAATRRHAPGALVLTVLLLGAVLLTLGAAHAICAATMTDERAAVSAMSMSSDHDGGAAAHSSAMTAVAMPSMPGMVGGAGDCMLGAGLLCLLIAALIAAGLRIEHAWSATRTGSSMSRPWPWHLPGAASPSLTVLSISRT